MVRTLSAEGVRVPPGFAITGKSKNSPLAAMEDRKRRYFGVQFHPEVTHTAQGQAIMRRFVREICACPGDWTASNIVADGIARVQQAVGKNKVLLGLSGGVDSRWSQHCCTGIGIS
jgi:GMP synthase (glutamine-hydrolysing)